MLGAIARIANPDEAPYVLHGFVIAVDTINHIFYIDDANGDLYNLLIASDNAMLTVFDNHDTGINEEAVHTAGTWEEESIEFSEELGGVTVFTTSSAFPAHAVGWTLQPNANKPIFFPILSVSGGTLTALGDLTGVAQAGDQYFILHPPGIDKTNGAVNTNATEQTTRFLAFGYQYLTPMAGVDTGEGIAGRQGGNNLAGQYQVWNRNYLPDIGRWTTPDPAMSPWSNLMDYVGQTPLTSTDPSGLDPGPPSPAMKCYVEVLIYISGGFMGTGHADIAVTHHYENGTTTSTVFGKHREGKGNKPGLKNSVWKRRSLKDYVNDEWGDKEKVVVCRKEVPCDDVTRLETALLDKWNTDNRYSALKNNCSQAIGGLLKEYKLIDKRNENDEMDGSDFTFPEDDLYDGYLKNGSGWECTGVGYISKTAGSTLYDSWVANKPAGKPESSGGKGKGGSS